jgi:hypothetical protein
MTTQLQNLLTRLVTLLDDAGVSFMIAGILAASSDVLDRAYVERWVADLDLAEEWRAALAAAP